MRVHNIISKVPSQGRNSDKLKNASALILCPFCVLHMQKAHLARLIYGFDTSGCLMGVKNLEPLCSHNLVKNCLRLITVDSPICSSCGKDWLLITSMAHLAATTCWMASMLMVPHPPTPWLWCKLTKTPEDESDDENMHMNCSIEYLNIMPKKKRTCLICVS